MVKRIIVLAGIIVASYAAYRIGQRIYTKSFSPEATSIAEIGSLKISINFSSPLKKARVIFADNGLVPFGEVWRTGANEATQIHLSTDVLVSGELLPAGDYALFSIPGKDEWTIIFNKELNQWGSFTYDSSDDQLRIKVPSSNLEGPLESFGITLEQIGQGIDMSIAWDQTMVKVPFEIAN